MAGYRPPYTVQEEIEILKYIIEREAYHRLRGRAFWQEMELAGVANNRTHHSLKEHFRKFMVRKLHRGFYRDIEENELEKIRKVYESSAVGQRYRSSKPDKEVPDIRVTPPSSDSDD